MAVKFKAVYYIVKGKQDNPTKSTTKTVGEIQICVQDMTFVITMMDAISTGSKGMDAESFIYHT